MGERQAERPVIYIDPQKARELDHIIAKQINKHLQLILILKKLMI